MKLPVAAGLIAALVIAGAADARGRHAPRQTGPHRSSGAAGLLAMDGMTGAKGGGLDGMGGASLTTGGPVGGPLGGKGGGGGLGGGSLSIGGKHSGGGGDLSGLGGGHAQHGGGHHKGGGL